MPNEPSVTPGVIRISSMLKAETATFAQAVFNEQVAQSMHSASDSERYAPSTMRQYSRTAVWTFVVWTYRR